MRLTDVRTGRRPLALVVGTAIISVTACGSGDSDPTATPALSSRTTTPRAPRTTQTGSPTTLPWWSKGRLHVEGEIIPTRMRRIVSRGGTTIVGRTTQRRSAWLALRGNHLVPLVSVDEPGVEPVLSANGRYAAWTTSRTLRRVNRYTTERVVTVHAYDVARGRRVGTTSLESRVTCCDQGGVISMLAIDDDGTVVLTRSYRHVWAWRPGRAPVDVLGPVNRAAAPPDDQWPGGVTWLTTGNGAGPAAFGRVSHSGEVTRVGRLTQGVQGLWSPDGTSYAFRTLVGRSDAFPPAVWTSGRRVRMQVPPPSGLVGWESARSVIVRTGRRPTVLYRCAARSGACEQAGPPLRHAVLSAYAG